MQCAFFCVWIILAELALAILTLCSIYLQLDEYKIYSKSEKKYAIFCVAIKPGHHPVKRRGVTSVTKCHKCNGTGIIFIGKYQSFLFFLIAH